MAEEQVGYAFTWLTTEGEKSVFELVKHQVQAANPILGTVELEPFKGLTELPQGFASAWDGVKKLTGAEYTAMLCVAKQKDKTVKGVNYWFIAGQTFTNKDFERHLVFLAINEFEGNYEYVNGSIIRLI